MSIHKYITQCECGILKGFILNGHIILNREESITCGFEREKHAQVFVSC